MVNGLNPGVSVICLVDDPDDPDDHVKQITEHFHIDLVFQTLLTPHHFLKRVGESP